MLGSIESNFQNNDKWHGAGESSIYKSIESKITRTAEGKIGPKKENAEVFARRFVDDVLRGVSGQVWRGAMAQTTRAVGYHAPASVVVRDNVKLQPAPGGVVDSKSNADQAARTLCSCPGVDWMTWQKASLHSSRESSVHLGATW